ncbi:hypothetical protein QJS10_CPB22g00936 [Acorus calamus]|uniref:DDT domain-containing protein DDR4 n=1 Tax=Acorus calamus TaxID=4465 RepID=A0AAV9C1P8_ACOCL|nr:hypothetical protein QJS10_CPB22g00936 [Acorus calamus]
MARDRARRPAGDGEGSVGTDSEAGVASETEPGRTGLRRRWELASVLNFLHVFRPVIQSKSELMEFSAEEIETALMTPNRVSERIHVALLKGIPPVSKNLGIPDAWVTAVCKKLAEWWPWVAEGEVPLKAAHGEERAQYKELDPTVRLLILKALCEIRAEQDDIVNYINDTMKQGDQLSTFCKDKLGGDKNGTSYWHDGDPVIGHRLYKEISKVEQKLRLKGKAQLAQAAVIVQWETLATNLEEFQEISDKLSSSDIKDEAAVGKIVKMDIIPTLEQLQKKKERALKRQQREALLLNGFSFSQRICNGRSLRERSKPVRYTFEDFDRSIDEAIKISKRNPKPTEESDGEDEQHEQENKDSTPNEKSQSDDELLDSHDDSPPNIDDDEKLKRASDSENGDEDDDYEAGNDEEHDDADGESDLKSDKSDGEDANVPPKKRQRYVRNIGPVTGLRRSTRNSQAETNTRLRQRPQLNSNYNFAIVSDSEDDDSANAKQRKKASDDIVDDETDSDAEESPGGDD